MVPLYATLTVSLFHITNALKEASLNCVAEKINLLQGFKMESSGSQPWQRLDSCCREEFGYLTHAIGLRAKLGQVKKSKGGSKVSVTSEL